LEKDGREGKKRGGVEELGSSQSGGREQGVFIGKRDGLMRLLRRRVMTLMMITMTINLLWLLSDLSQRKLLPLDVVQVRSAFVAVWW